MLHTIVHKEINWDWLCFQAMTVLYDCGIWTVKHVYRKSHLTVKSLTNRSTTSPSTHKSHTLQVQELMPLPRFLYDRGHRKPSVALYPWNVDKPVAWVKWTQQSEIWTHLDALKEQIIEVEYKVQGVVSDVATGNDLFALDWLVVLNMSNLQSWTAHPTFNPLKPVSPKNMTIISTHRCTDLLITEQKDC